MNGPLPAKKVGKPRKVVTDESRAKELLEELRVLELEIRQLMERRLKLILEANELGLTSTRISESVGASQATVSKWIRTAGDPRAMQ